MRRVPTELDIKLDTAIRKLVELQEQGKRCYQDAERVFTEDIRPRMRSGQVFFIETLVASEPGTTRVQIRKYKLVDNFAKANTTFRATRVTRFELVDVTDKKPKKRKKA